jgi:hypothetical protein
MNLETTVAHLNELEPRRRGIQRTYSRYRELTEEAFGSAAAGNIEGVVSDIFTCIGRRIVGQLCQEDMVGLLEQNGWRISDNPHLTEELIYCHDLASVEQRGKLSGHSQFDGAFSLKGLNAKYFDVGSERTVVLLNDGLPGSVVALSNLGDPPDQDYAFGLKAVLPHQADYLLWWATKHSNVWKHFAEPTDLGEKSWAVLQPSFDVDRTRSFAKCALGRSDFHLGPSRSEERFYLSAFGVAEPEQKYALNQGSYLAYHVM